MRRYGGFVALWFLLSGFIANAGLLAADPRTFRALLWSDREGGPLNHAMEAGLEEFETASGGKYAITVEWVAPDRSEARLAELEAAGNFPDVFMTRAGDLNKHVEEKAAYALDGELAQDAKWRERFPAPLLRILSVGGKVYAVPIAQTAAVLYYNTEVFEKAGISAPASYEDLKKAIEALNQNGVTPIAFGNREGWEGALLSQVIETRLGGGRHYERLQGSTRAWSDPSFIAAGNVLAELVRLRAFLEGFEEMTNDQAITYFKRGRAGMLVSRDRLFVTLNFSNSAVRGKVNLAEFPSFENGDPNAWVGSPDFNLVINEKSQAKEAAVGFLKAYSTAELQEHFAGHAFVPAAGAQINKDLLAPLLAKLLEMQSSMTSMSLIFDDAFTVKGAQEYADAIRAILAGLDPGAAFLKLQAESRD